MVCWNTEGKWNTQRKYRNREARRDCAKGMKVEKEIREGYGGGVVGEDEGGEEKGRMRRFKG